MVAGLCEAPSGGLDPHIRPVDAWRDGAAVANLLELAFRDEGIDDSGRRILRALRYHGPLDALMLGASPTPGFVWVEDGQVVGTASLQRNPTRRDTWMIGNVATHPAYRNRGISTALIRAALAYACARGAHAAALQVVEGNAPALRVYEKNGFKPCGAVTHYRRPSVRAQPLAEHMPGADRQGRPATAVRRAQLDDGQAVWRLTRWNVPDALTYAEPFDAGTYRLGWRWWLNNALHGNRDHWLVAERDRTVVGALRARVNFDQPEHHVELMLGDGEDPETGMALLQPALRRFAGYVSKPVYGIQARPHEASQSALQACGFEPIRTLIHMVVRLEG